MYYKNKETFLGGSACDSSKPSSCGKMTTCDSTTSKCVTSKSVKMLFGVMVLLFVLMGAYAFMEYGKKGKKGKR